jgi:hypothetical protein
MHNLSDSQPQILTIKTLRLVGYVLLLLSLFDIIGIFIPARFMNPEWELQAMTELVERVAVPLIGLAFVFYQDLQHRIKLEFLILKGFSWGAFFVGIAYLVLLPLVVVNSFRLDNVLIQQANVLVEQRMTQVDQIQVRLKQAVSKPEVTTLFSRFSGQPLPPILADKNFPELKQELLANIEKGKSTIRKQAESEGQERRLKLLKTSLKAFFGALISGACFIYVWVLTRWIRRFRFDKRSPAAVMPPIEL